MPRCVSYAADAPLTRRLRDEWHWCVGRYFSADEPRDQVPSRPDQDPLSTLATINRLDAQLGDCDHALARGIVTRAIAHLERDLLVHLTGPDHHQRSAVLFRRRA